MTTIKITVDTQGHATLLSEVLNALGFVKKVETDVQKPDGVQSQYCLLKKILTKHAGKNLFKEIKDPVKWQKKIRDEWE